MRKITSTKIVLHGFGYTEEAALETLNMSLSSQTWLKEEDIISVETKQAMETNGPIFTAIAYHWEDV